MLFHGAPDGDNDLTKPIRYIDRPFQAYNQEYYNAMKIAYIDTLCKISKKMKFLLHALFLSLHLMFQKL